MIRNGPKTRASKGAAGSGRRRSISSDRLMLFRSLASRTQTARPSGAAALEDPECQPVVGPWHHGRGERASAPLPRAEVDGLVAEEHVVGPAGRREPRLRLGARRLPGVRLPLEQRRCPVPRPCELGDDEPRDERDADHRSPARDAHDRRRDRDREDRREEDQVPRLGRGRAAELRDDERRCSRAHEAEDEDRGRSGGGTRCRPPRRGPPRA